jgi:hypothetical protein
MLTEGETGSPDEWSNTGVLEQKDNGVEDTMRQWSSERIA